ncbi:class I SAM-dependent methyltransferase [Trichocoleus desertorum AS-A10]|uniref:class I SAM-dependent methyltransferase n=1 Tax=Trichocoleus desertorum TaxID=1481672 RepID=UPI003296FEFC
MAVRKDTIFERFLSPVLQLFIDRDGLEQFYRSIDWETQSDRFRNPTLVYPAYYSTQNFHGVEKGYLNPRAAVSYDPITQYVLLPNETLIRQAAIATVQGKPRRILDLGCGTGSTTLLLKQTFPEAEVIGLDFSPYMLVMADYKAQQAGLNIKFIHANAEQTGLLDGSFDLVTASLLFHETPPTISRAILQEAARLLKPGGEVLILDGSQNTLRQTEWLTQIFEEPYMQAYATGSVDAWMGAAGFGAVQTQELWWIHQITWGIKPLPGHDPESARPHPNSVRIDDSAVPDTGCPAPAFE